MEDLPTRLEFIFNKFDSCVLAWVLWLLHKNNYNPKDGQLQKRLWGISDFKSSLWVSGIIRLNKSCGCSPLIVFISPAHQSSPEHPVSRGTATCWTTADFWILTPRHGNLRSNKYKDGQWRGLHQELMTHPFFFFFLNSTSSKIIGQYPPLVSTCHFTFAYTFWKVWTVVQTFFFFFQFSPKWN